MNTIVPELVVVTLLIEELLMTAMLHNLAIVNNVDLVHIFYGGQPVGNSDCSAPNLGSIQGILYNLKQKSSGQCFNLTFECVHTFSLSVSRAEVASSRSRILGFLTRALAMATLCFCPPES